MDVFISTGQLADLFDLPKHTIRHYVDEKLLTPQINPINGYQQFYERDVYKLYQILFFRKIGLSIEKIKDILKEDTILPALDEAVSKLEEQIKELQAVQATVEKIVSANKEQPIDQMNFVEKEIRYLKELPKDIKQGASVDLVKAHQLGFTQLELFYFLVDESLEERMYVRSDENDYDLLLSKGVYACLDIELENEGELEQAVVTLSEDPLFEISQGKEIIFYENIYRSLGFSDKQLFTLEFKL